MSRREHAWALVLALVVALLYSVPQLLYVADGHPDALVQSMDEAPYFARVQEVMDGHWRVTDQYLWETKAGPAILPASTELVVGGVGRAFRQNMETTIVVARVLAAIGLTLGVTWLAFLLTQSASWSLVAAAFVLLEPGTYYYKPFQYLTSYTLGYPEPASLHLLYSRFHNPVVLAVPFALAAAAIYRALQTNTRRDAHIAAVLLGLNFYTQVFYWAYLYAGISVLLLAEYGNTPRVRTIVTVAVLGLLWGGYALFEQVSKTQALQGQDVLTRGGLLLRTRTPIYGLPKAFLALTLLFAVLTRPRDLAYKWLLSCLVGGYLLLNQNVITGREIQNYHFNYANAIVFTVAMALLAERSFSGRAFGLPARWRHMAPLAAATVVGWLVVNTAILQANSYNRHMRATTVGEGAYPSNLKARFRGTLNWVRRNTPIDSVFLADPELSFLLPMYTSANVFLDPLQDDHVYSFISEPALYERWMIYEKLQGLTSDELFEVVKSQSSMPFLGWGYGRNERLLATYDFSTMDSFNRALRADRLPRDYVREFERFDTGQIPVALRHYRLDYLIVRDSAPRFREGTSAALRQTNLRPVARVDREGVTIYRIDPRD